MLKAMSATNPNPVTVPTIVCEFPTDLPEYNIKAGDWMIVTNLGEPYGAVLSRRLDGPTAQLLLTQASAAVYALPASRPRRRPLRLVSRRPRPATDPRSS